MSHFRKLLVWDKAYALAVRTHRIGAGMRRAVDLSLRNQMVRAANSIAANIAEGRRQSSEKEFARFLNIALNSAFELEHHLTIAAAVGALTETDEASLVSDATEIRKMLYGLLRRIKERLEQEKKRERGKNDPPLAR